MSLSIGLCLRSHKRILGLLRDAFPHDDIFECSSDEVAAAALDADVLIPITSRIPNEAFAGERLKLIQQYGVGLDIVDIPAATRAGVWVANVPSVGTGNAESVAELAIAHMLMLSRDMPTALQRFRERRFGAPLGKSLWKSTVVILGYGGIGEEIARRLAGFDMRILAISKDGPSGQRKRDPSIKLTAHVAQVEGAALLAEADYVIVAAPAVPENIGLVNAPLLAQIKRGAYIINIGRGAVIEYGALLAALRSGHIAGAGLDVFWQEPFDPDDPLLKENVIATPHIGGVTEPSLLGIGDAVLANIEALRRGEVPTCCANPHARDAAPLLV
jgi:lactate dehydrogenase-like 2-hydroxyacid dehydrogenase